MIYSVLKSKFLTVDLSRWRNKKQVLKLTK